MFNSLEEIKNANIKNLTDLKKYRNTVGVLALSNFGGLTVATATADSDIVFYQFYDNEIEETEIEYYNYEEVKEFINMDEEEFKRIFYDYACGFKVADNIYLLNDFILI